MNARKQITMAPDMQRRAEARLQILLALFALRYFHLLKSWTDVRRKIDRLLGRRRVVQYALAQVQVLDLEVERCGSAQELGKKRPTRCAAFARKPPHLPGAARPSYSVRVPAEA